MSDPATETCPLCKLATKPSVRDPKRHAVLIFECPNCGRYHLHESLIVAWAENVRDNAVVSHAIRKQQGLSNEVLVTPEWRENILRNASLPNPSEQANNFLLWLGQLLERKGPGYSLIPYRDGLRATIGAQTSADVQFVQTGLMKDSIIESFPTQSSPEIRLTFKGWERYERLKRQSTNSRVAFMAMQYGDDQLNEVFERCFRPAADRAGYSLEKLEDSPKPGLIDVRMEVEIRRSRFVVADLTHQNLGAYWEAGFASGLDKPVIYTCRSDVSQSIHFDTNHRFNIKWDPNVLDDAGTLLTATIRAALPSEANLEDK